MIASNLPWRASKPSRLASIARAMAVPPRGMMPTSTARSERSNAA
jgi:hypothetical protein